MIKLLKLAVLAGVVVLVSPGPGSAVANYDGDWSVVVITEQGDCDRAYRYPLTVTNGSIQYLNGAGVSITGRVDAHGRLRATISRGAQHADGSGRLNASTGSGTWTGKDSVKQCSGRWEAERRG